MTSIVKVDYQFHTNGGKTERCFTLKELLEKCKEEKQPSVFLLFTYTEGSLSIQVFSKLTSAQEAAKNKTGACITRYPLCS